MKRKHLEAGFLFIAGLIVLLILGIIPSFTGFTIQNENTVIPYTDGFIAKDLSARINNEIIDVKFTLKENENRNRDLSVIYELFNAQGKTFENDKLDFILSAKDEAEYKFSFKTSENVEIASLGIEIIDKETNERVYTSTLITNPSITGNAVNSSNGPVRASMAFIAFILVLGALAYTMKLIYTRKARKTLISEVHDGNLIKVR